MTYLERSRLKNEGGALWPMSHLPDGVRLLPGRAVDLRAVGCATPQTILRGAKGMRPLRSVVPIFVTLPVPILN